MNIFKWFTESLPAASAQKPASSPFVRQSVAELVKAIHDDYDQTADNSLAWAKQVLGKPVPVSSRVEQLKKLGFASNPEVQANETKVGAHHMEQSLAKRVAYYQKTYPNYRFLTLQQISDINKKWGLVFVPVKYYKGDVPEKNLQEIAAFSGVKKEDSVYRVTSRFQIKRFVPYKETSLQHDDIRRESALEHLYYRSPIQDSYESHDIEPLHISCPPSDVDARIQNTDYAPGKDGMSPMRITIPDPIVIQPVAGGGLILSKWGPEASDERTVNLGLN